MGQSDLNLIKGKNNNEKSTTDFKILFEDYEHNPPSLSDALNQMFKSSNLDDKKIKLLTKDILDKCKLAIDEKFNIINQKFNNITKDDAYIICSFTIEANDRQYCPYKLLNTNLNSFNRENGLKNISKYLYLLLKSLRKLPRYYPSKNNKYFYRGITPQLNISKNDFNDDSNSYFIGSKKTFLGITSACPEPQMAYNYLRSDDNKKVGTIFLLGGDVWGYDIELFSFYREKEILLEPGINYIVESALPPLNGIVYITCKIINSDDNALSQEKSSVQNQENIKTDNNIQKNIKIENENLISLLIEKENEIKELKNKIQNNIIEKPKYDINDIMVINFISSDSSIHCGIKCLSTDVFAEVEEKLYKKYDNLRNFNNTFIVNNKPILRFKKLSENNIMDGDVIQFFKQE